MWKLRISAPEKKRHTVLKNKNGLTPFFYEYAGQTPAAYEVAKIVQPVIVLLLNTPVVPEVARPAIPPA